MKIPVGFSDRVERLVAILRLDTRGDFLDQLGFVAQLAFAEADGFEFPGEPGSLWSYIGRSKKKRNPAGYLKKSIRDDLGPERWNFFLAKYPHEAHCQWLLSELHSGRISEG